VSSRTKETGRLQLYFISTFFTLNFLLQLFYISFSPLKKYTEWKTKSNDTLRGGQYFLLPCLAFNSGSEATYSGETETINVEKLPTGNYMVQVQTQAGSMNYNFVKL